MQIVASAFRLEQSSQSQKTMGPLRVIVCLALIVGTGAAPTQFDADDDESKKALTASRDFPDDTENVDLFGLPNGIEAIIKQIAAAEAAKIREKSTKSGTKPTQLDADDENAELIFGIPSPSDIANAAKGAVTSGTNAITNRISQAISPKSIIQSMMNKVLQNVPDSIALSNWGHSGMMRPILHAHATHSLVR